MSYEINQQAVVGVLKECNAALDGKGFNHGEVLIGLAELIGRTIVEVSKNEIQTKELMDVVGNHVARTITIGANAKGKSLYVPG